MKLTRRIAATALVVAVPLAVTACTGDSGGGNQDNPDADVTITFWHGWSADSEIAAIQANVEAFEKDNPNIHVKVVPNVTDDKINQALRAGGPKAPDVVSSFETTNVGQFCTTGAFVDLTQFMSDSGIDPSTTFPAAMLNYTQYQGNQCSLPLLGDAYGLYYSKDAFAAAGISGPPKTLSEFDADAVKLTKQSGDTYSQLGFMPNFHGYETTTGHYLGTWSPTYFTADGKSNVADDPVIKQMFEWQRALVGKLGGYDRLEKYRNTFGDEFGAKNPFMTGQVAMALDGEWRAGMIQDAAPDLNFGVAPFPVPDDQADEYGKGYLSGTIIGIASTSQKQNAAWRFVQYLTTNTKAVVDFANAIHNVPSTQAALASPDVDQDPNMQAFIKIAANPNSNTNPATPNGDAYDQTLQDLGYDIESGKQPDIQAGLEHAAEQIDTDLEQAQ
jgi:multiple sugar transport system substrate-binding protein